MRASHSLSVLSVCRCGVAGVARVKAVLIFFDCADSEGILRVSGGLDDSYEARTPLKSLELMAKGWAEVEQVRRMG